MELITLDRIQFPEYHLIHGYSQLQELPIQVAAAVEATGVVHNKVLETKMVVQALLLSVSFLL